MIKLGARRRGLIEKHVRRALILSTDRKQLVLNLLRLFLLLPLNLFLPLLTGLDRKAVIGPVADVATSPPNLNWLRALIINVRRLKWRRLSLPRRTRTTSTRPSAASPTRRRSSSSADPCPSTDVSRRRSRRRNGPGGSKRSRTRYARVWRRWLFASGHGCWKICIPAVCCHENYNSNQ